MPLLCQPRHNCTKGESTETAIDEIVHMAVSQKAFFGKKGGVTFSGGEPTLQAKALIPLFQRLKEQNNPTSV